MNNHKIRMAVAGAGSMGLNHIRNIHELSNYYELVGIYDPIEEKKRIADDYGIKFYSSYEELLSEVDGVTLAGPTSTHYEMALEASAARVHALIEKPITVTLDEAKRVISAYSSWGGIMTVSCVERYSPIIKVLPDIIKDEEIVAIEVHRCSPFDKRIFDVDVISDLMIHDADIVLNAIERNDPIIVEAIGKKVFSEHNVDYAQATLMFEDGVLGFITSSRATQDKIRKLVIHAKRSYIEADMLRKTLIIKHGIRYRENIPNVSYRQSGITEHIEVPNTEPLKEEYISFAKAVLEKTPLVIDAEQILRAMQTLDHIKAKIYSYG